ncbi:MAG: hypothetical protein ACYDCC_08150 [Actinomycetota bacterium]
MLSNAIDTLVIDLWIDGQGRARKVSYRFNDRGFMGSGLIDATVEYFNFGVAVNVQAPDPSEIGTYVPPSLYSK